MIRYLLLLVVTLSGILSVSAQQWTGQWTIYPIVGAKYDRVIDTDSKVYFLSSGSMYSYDKDSKETYFYNTSNKLSGSNIKNIYYNHEDKYLLVVYADNNIDMIYDDGRYYCLPDIRDANISEDKTINDIAFCKGRFIAATNFGIVIYDADKHEVLESGIYRKPVENVAICGDNILIYLPYKLMTAKLNTRINNLNNFNELRGMFTDRMIDISDNCIAWVDLNNKCLTFTDIDFENLKSQNRATSVKVDNQIDKWSGGFFFRSGDDILLYDNEGNMTDQFSLNETLKNTVASLWKGKASVWLGGIQGAANFDMSGSSPTVLSDWYRPESGTCREVAYFYLSPDGERIYAGNLGPTTSRDYFSHSSYDGDGLKQRQTTDVIEAGEIRDVSLIEASAKSSEAKKSQALYNDKAMYGGVTRLAEDPLDPDTYFIGNGQEGLYVVKDRKEIWKFDVDNTPFKSYWETRVFDVNFDPDGNMWVGHAHNTDGYPAYIILPADKLRKGYDKISKSDWLLPDLKDFSPFSKDFISLFCDKSNYAFFLNSGSFDGFYVLDTKGTYANVKDDKCYNLNTLTDQDGNSLQPQYYYAVVEDGKGRVWLGSKQGIFYVNAASGIDENTVVVRPKVPRNDGTNFADFLLDSDQINSIAVDPSDRKWIATDASGVYLVSEDGSRIINHFDSSNSPLPTNRVTAVVCDPHSNIVYFGTTDGLLSYKSDSAPAREDYSEVYAYPNPVRPDYTGWITIAWLMDNSLVKITDSAGNVIYQGTSEGGMLSWDGCNSAGERVRTGVYYVYASTGGNGQSSSGAVTKIMVVK